MEIDLAQLDSDATASDLLRAEICIIGGGIAGLTLAHKLVALGRDVLLLESGGNASAGFSPVTQTGYPHPGTSESRPRALGGTSLTWGGQLLPLPEDTGWPVSFRELAPFTTEAEHLLAVDSLSYEAARFFAEVREAAPALLGELPQLAPSLSKFAPFAHRNLASTIGRELRGHSNVRIVLHAHVGELLLAPVGDRVIAALIKTASQRVYRVEANHFVIAAGTIESVRLLLASRSVAPEGIGNQHNQVGRNFHDHISVSCATLREPARTELLNAFRPWIYRGTVHSLKLAASRELEAELNLLPILAHLTIEEPDSSGVGALRTLLRARQQHNLRPALGNALQHLPRALADSARLALWARVHHRRYVSPQARVELRLNLAQRTPSDSRITVSPDGAPVLNWRIDPAEFSTLRSYAHHLRTHLALEGIEWNSALFTRESAEPVPDLDDARHAMGGACMGDDPRNSVVDANLRVHGIGNLFVASAAVFPDGRPQLPTLPLMALTLRLAHHVRSLTP